jgi:hypothetical protein
LHVKYQISALEKCYRFSTLEAYKYVHTHSIAGVGNLGVLGLGVRGRF